MIEEKERALFHDWSKVRKNFCPDGVIDEQSYLVSKPRLLFLMKEVNGKDGESLDLKKFIREGGRPQTWDNIARWVYGIRNLEREIGWAKLEAINTDEKRAELFKSICVMNLKKSSGRIITDNKQLNEVAKDDTDFLTQQFNLYDPNLIIACGSAVRNTFFSFIEKNEPDWKQTTRGIEYCRLKPSMVLISYSHPEARVQDCLLYYGLIDTVKEIYKH
jgi:hypothetical protein